MDYEDYRYIENEVNRIESNPTVDSRRWMVSGLSGALALGASTVTLLIFTGTESPELTAERIRQRTNQGTEQPQDRMTEPYVNDQPRRDDALPAVDNAASVNTATSLRWGTEAN